MATHKRSELIKQAIDTFRMVERKGSKWKNRNIPIYIRNNLMTPYYTSHEKGNKILAIMTLPNSTNPKVHFRKYIERPPLNTG